VLVARLAKLKAEQENKEYLRMVSSITQPKVRRCVWPVCVSTADGQRDDAYTHICRT